MRDIIFLDRDGVINKDPGGWTEHSYVTRREDFIFLPNSIEALKILNEAGYDIVVISNQAGVGKGHYTSEKLEEVNRKMVEEVEKCKAKLAAVYYCIHKKDDDCDCRKPKTGLFKKAEKDLKVEAKGKFFIGDNKTDIKAGIEMGMSTILLLSGKTDLELLKDWDIKPDYIFDNLYEAANFIINKPTTYGGRRST